MNLVAWLVVAFLALKLVGLVVNLLLFPRLKRGGTRLAHDVDESGTPDVSLLLPVRNEAERLPFTLPGVLAQPADEIVLLDDGSTDRTAVVARRLAGGDPRVRIVRGGPLPPGWVGKTWACRQAADEARGDLLVFLDADVHLERGALAAVVGEMERQGADAFSVFPRQRTGSLAERTLLPLIDAVLLSFLPFPLLRAQVPSAAVANGQLFAFRREAYERIGGHDAVRGEILEDVLLARHARQQGLRLGLALGGEAVSVRMYRSFEEMVAGLGKSLLAAFGGSRAWLAAAAVGHLVVYTLPVILMLGEPRWGLPVVLAFAERVLVNRMAGRGAYWEVLLVPLAPLLALPVFARAAAPRKEWRDRSYE